MTVQDKYDLLKQSVLQKQQVHATYDNLLRVFCVQQLGYTHRVPHCFVWQFGGETEPTNTLPGYRCMFVEQLEDITLHDGWEWPTKGADPDERSTCVRVVDVVPAPDDPDEGSLDS